MKHNGATIHAWSWVIDPIQSFQNGSEGQQSEQLIFSGAWAAESVNDPILWKAGKRAFDIIEKYLADPITQAELDDFLASIPGELIELWNSHKDLLDTLIKEGKLVVIPFNQEEPIKEFSSLNIETDGFWDCYTIEPHISAIDSVYDSLNLQVGDEVWPFNRELLAAFFTICHIGGTAASATLNDADAEAYAWVNYWFDKLDAYNRTKEIIDQRQKYLKSQKSQIMNAKRHSKRNEAMQLVTDDWSQRTSEFRSAERAGIHYADWLEKKGFEYEPRTITTWIRKHAKDSGIRLR